MKHTKLAKAIAYAIAGTALAISSISVASAATTSMYNLTTSGGADNSTNTTNPTTGGNWALSGNTDGWLYDFTGSSSGTDTSIAKWAGTTGTNKTPFGYTGAHLNWGFEITGGNGGTGEISTNQAFAKYGVYADIDTAKGAWSDNSINGASGWRHDLEFGLFKSDTTGAVTLSAQGILQSGTDFGFTIFKGMSANTSYGHHGAWNGTNNAGGLLVNAPNPAYNPALPVSGSNPLTIPGSLPGGGTNFDPDGAGPQTAIGQIVAYSIGGNSPSNLNTISFNAEAGQIYTIVLGGYRNGSWGDTIDGYQLTISQVPVPGAVWLFGSALAGFVGVSRRKSIAAA